MTQEIHDSGSVQQVATKRRLEELDWDFATQQSESPFSKLHWHPCRFPSQVPATAISRLSKPSQIILDPFMGSATTLAEAQRLGRRSVGIDINPISVLMARSKLLENGSDEVGSYVDRLSTLVASQWESIRPSDIPEGVQADKWFAPETLLELRKIWALLDGEDEGLLSIGKAAFSSILLSVCKETRHWGYVCDNSTPKTDRAGDAKNAFLRTLSQYKAAYKYRDQSMRDAIPDAQVFLGNARSKLSEWGQESFDLLVTSPPYFGVADYAKAQRLSMEWFGLEIEPVRRAEIGARSKRHRKTAGHDFVSELNHVFTEAFRVLKSGAYATIVFGSSPSRKDPFPEFMGSLEAIGFQLVSEIPRNISSMRRQNPSLSTEHVVVFRKE